MTGVVCEDEPRADEQVVPWWENDDHYSYTAMSARQMKKSVVPGMGWYRSANSMDALDMLVAAVLRENREGRPHFSMNVRLALDHAGAVLGKTVK